MTTIYKLVDPRDNSIFYIGQTICPLKIRVRGGYNSMVKERMQSIKKDGYKTKIIEIERVEGVLSIDAEARQIRLHEEMGIELLNIDCTKKYSSITRLKEQKERMRILKELVEKAKLQSQYSI